MNRALQIAHLGLLLSGVALFACGARLLWTLNRTVTAEASRITMATDQLTATLQTINRPCNEKDAKGKLLKPGTLCQVGSVLNTARLTLGQVEIAAHHEDERIGAMDAQETEIAGDTHALLGKAGVALDTLDTTIRGVQPAEARLTAAIASLETAEAGINSTLPQLQRTMTNLAALSASANETSQHLDATAGDVQQAVHSFTHPTWPKKVWNAVTGVGIGVAKFFF